MYKELLDLLTMLIRSMFSILILKLYFSIFFKKLNTTIFSISVWVIYFIWQLVIWEYITLPAYLNLIISILLVSAIVFLTS